MVEEDFEEDFIDCYINNKHSDLGQHCWDWIYYNFADQIYPDSPKTLDEHYDHMIKNHYDYYIHIGMSKSCKCMSCRDGVGLISIDKSKNSKIYLLEWIKKKESLAYHYFGEMNKFIAFKTK